MLYVGFHEGGKGRHKHTNDHDLPLHFFHRKTCLIARALVFESDDNKCNSYTTQLQTERFYLTHKGAQPSPGRGGGTLSLPLPLPTHFRRLT